VSKVAQEMLAMQYWHSYGMRTVVTRAFNHEGPRRGDVFVTSSFAKQVAEVELGKRPPTILVGDLSPQRDWTDVRDVVRAYWLALEKGKPGEVYNIGSGRCRTVKEMLETLLSLASAKITVKQDPARLRPSDVMLLLGDSSKFQQATGWKPTIPLERTLEDSLNYWRNRLKTGTPLPVSS
jgi:GDP-4-dehydro-6-deoxy-D-mannose reductase